MTLFGPYRAEPAPPHEDTAYPGPSGAEPETGPGVAWAGAPAEAPAATPGTTTPGTTAPPGTATTGATWLSGVVQSAVAARTAGTATDAAGAAATTAGAAATSAAMASIATAAGDPAAATATLPPPPGGPDRGTVYAAPPRRIRRGRGWRAPLHAGTHTAATGTLATLAVPARSTGMILGDDADRDPVVIRLSRPEPTRVALVGGGGWALRLLVWRALALGTRVAVFSSAPAEWYGFGERATGRSDRFTVLPEGHPVDPPPAGGAAPAPVLLCHDVGPLGPRVVPPPRPWCTQVTLLRELTGNGVPVVQNADLVMLRRLPAAQAQVAGVALRLSADSTGRLPLLEDTMLALVGGGADRYVWLSPTSIEAQVLGPPGH